LRAILARLVLVEAAKNAAADGAEMATLKHVRGLVKSLSQ
jgi:hypothetical protein